MKTCKTRLRADFKPGAIGESANAFLADFAEDMVIEYGRGAIPGVTFMHVSGEAMADWLECNANDRNGRDWVDALSCADDDELDEVADQVAFALREPSTFAYEQLGRCIAQLVEQQLRNDLLTELTYPRLKAATDRLIARGQIGKFPKLTETGELA